VGKNVGVESRKQAEKPMRWVSGAGKQAENPEPEIELKKQKQKPRTGNKSNF